MTLLRDLQSRAANRPAHIVLSEGHDPRVVAGAVAAVEKGIARITLVGDTETVKGLVAAEGGAGIEIQDPAISPLTSGLAAKLVELRGHKGMTPEKASIQVQEPLVFAALMVRAGHADGTVGGAVHTTSDTVRAALQIIGKSPDAALVSSFFLMGLPEGHSSGRSAMIFSDCGLVIDPNATELAAIAAQSAQSFEQLVQTTPKVALLSFSTMGSASHPAVSKVTDAAKILRNAHPEIASDGELQFDAAFVPSVGAAKAPESNVAGHANVMIFPNLDAGNIGYKIAQRIGGATALGPVLQGLNQPANDLSRGCTAEDVFGMIAVTVLQVK